MKPAWVQISCVEVVLPHGRYNGHGARVIDFIDDTFDELHLSTPEDDVGNVGFIAFDPNTNPEVPAERRYESCESLFEIHNTHLVFYEYTGITWQTIATWYKQHIINNRVEEVYDHQGFHVWLGVMDELLE